MNKPIETNCIVVVIENNEYKVKFINPSSITKYRTILIYEPIYLNGKFFDTSYLKNYLMKSDYFIDKRSKNFKHFYTLDDIDYIFKYMAHNFGAKITYPEYMKIDYGNKAKSTDYQPKIECVIDLNSDSDSDRMDVDEENGIPVIRM